MSTLEFTRCNRDERLLALDQLLRTRDGLTRESICARLSTSGFQTSERTFFRDIERLRSDYHAPLGGDPELPRQARQLAGKPDTKWKYDDMSWTLGKVEATEGDLFALFVAREVVQRYAGLPVGEELGRVYSGLAKTMNRKITIESHSLQPIAFLPEKRTPIRADIWKPLLEATMKQEQLRITYRKRWKGDVVSTRTVCPYRIASLQGEWYLLASASASDMSLRQYVISRISSAGKTGNPFAVPEDLNIDDALANTFGTFVGDSKQLVKVRLRFSKTVAPLVRAREFHPWQQLSPLKNGDVELSFDASTSGPWRLYHVKSWVLSWGRDVEVLEPQYLRREVAEEARCVGKIYSAAKT